MTTPNIEELATRLRDYVGTIFAPVLMCQAADLLQSQAERIKELECDVEDLQKDINEICNAIPNYYWCGGAAALIAECFAERGTLRAQLAAIVATEPVAWMLPSGEGLIDAAEKANEFCAYTRKYNIPLFTRPMPAQDGDAPALSVIKRLLKVHEDRGDADAESLAKVMLEDAKGAE